MARLNEPPAAPAPSAPSTSAIATTSTGEGVDALKRRFIRQNRELAKNNSTQSLRIRSLELDVSRLLEQNLDLRNQVLHLENELYKAQVQASSQAARKVKDDMKAKLAELSAIIDSIEEDAEVELPESLKPGRPIEGQWRERQPLREIMRESQMPTISEDRSFPRRTLGTDELRSIRLSDQSSTESPDLGPPPVARLDCDDPMKNASPLGDKHSPLKNVTAAGEEDLLPAALPANLETRRKRKEPGQSRLEVRRSSFLIQSPEKAEGEQPASAILRTGAKRKLADRESDKPIKPPSKGDFTFSRKVGGEHASMNVQQPTRWEDEVEEPTTTGVKPARRVLGEKSVNTSPRKTAAKSDKPVANEAEKPIAPVKAGAKDTSRRRRTSSIPLPSPPRDNILGTVDIAPLPTDVEAEHADPKTPAPLDLFSPTPSAPSTKPDDRRGDTPPPSDLSSLSLPTTDGGADARPSRRARAAVNYAEPSLISKMRRPDKKMVDAISGLQDPRRAMNPSSASGVTTVTIKPEPVDGEDDAWKHLPSVAPAEGRNGKDEEVFSPLDAKSNPPMRRVSGEWRFPSESRDGADAADTIEVLSTTAPAPEPTTISSLLAANGEKKRRHSTSLRTIPRVLDENKSTDLDVDVEAASKKLRELDLYDFKESSSPLTDNSTSSAERAKVGMQRSKTAQRRYSAMPRQENDGEKGSVTEGEVTSTLRREAGARMSRRRSMML